MISTLSSLVAWDIVVIKTLRSAVYHEISRFSVTLNYRMGPLQPSPRQRSDLMYLVVISPTYIRTLRQGYYTSDTCYDSWLCCFYYREGLTALMNCWILVVAGEWRESGGKYVRVGCTMWLILSNSYIQTHGFYVLTNKCRKTENTCPTCQMRLVSIYVKYSLNARKYLLKCVTRKFSICPKQAKSLYSI